MLSNKRISTLLLLASAVSPVLTAQAATDPETLAKIERLVDNATKVQIRMQKQIDAQAAEISSLRGQVEQSNYQIKQLTDRQRQLLIDLDNLRSSSVSSSSADVSTPSTTSSSAASAPASSGSEKDDYDAAVSLILKDKDYPSATAAFEGFVTTYPNSDYLPNAYYWLGQLYYQQNQDRSAAKNFAKVITYANSSKRADAYVKLGDIAKRNNSVDGAKKYYQKAIDEYPNSSSAKQAQAALASL